MKKILAIALLAMFIISCDKNGNSNSYEVEFHPNGGLGTMESILVDKGGTLVLPMNTFTSEGFEFTGWATTNTGAVEYADGAEFTPTSNVVLYAIWQKETENEIGEGYMRMVLVEGGTFSLGSRDADKEQDEGPMSEVTVNSFYMGIYEVTQEIWQDAMGSNPSLNVAENHPVERTMWLDAVEFCNTLSENEGLVPCYIIDGTDVSFITDANGYRLPTEAEWEYAAEGGQLGKGTIFPGGSNLGDLAWYQDNSDTKTHEVGLKTPNELGMYDMAGNVFEWCWDWYGAYTEEAKTNPLGPESGDEKSMRGGAFITVEKACRSSRRFNAPVDLGLEFFGLRLVRNAE